MKQLEEVSSYRDLAKKDTYAYEDWFKTDAHRRIRRKMKIENKEILKLQDEERVEQ